MNGRVHGVRLVVSAFVEREEEVLLIRRGAGLHAPVWELPGGKVELGEGPEETLAREVREETGLRVAVLAPVGSWWFRYDDTTQFVVFAHRARVLDPPRVAVRLDDDHDDALWIPVATLAARYAQLNADLAPRLPDAYRRMARLVDRYAARRLASRDDA